MTNQQYFERCVALAPNFRIGIEFPVQGRSLVWRGRRRDQLEEQSSGLLFPENSAFEPKLAFLLQQALVQLQQAG